MKYLKTFENMAMAKSIISKKMEGFDKLKNLLSKNLGYIGKFTEYLMNDNIPFSDLELLYKDLLELKNKQKNLDISDLKYEQVIDKIQETRNDISVNSLIQRFPSEQKAFAKELLKDLTIHGSNYNIFLKASKKENVDALVSKISRYKTSKDLLNALKLFSKDSMNDKEKVLDYINNSDSAKIAFQNDNILITKIERIEDVQKLGSDTSWCILGHGMWKNYTSGRYQYILYNFEKDDLDPLFKIGFTLNKDFTIHAAHDILDKGASSELKNILTNNNVLFSDLVPKEDIIDVTPEMINSLNTRSTLKTLESYSNSIKMELIPNLISKIIEISTKTSLTIHLTEGRVDILKSLINKYFSDKEYVTSSDLSKINKNITVTLNPYLGSKILRNKYLGTNPDFSLPADLVIKSLNIYTDEQLIKNFAKYRIDFIDIPGLSWMYSGETINFRNNWDKEKVKILTEKINSLFKGDWKGVLKKSDLNYNYVESIFIYNYILLNLVSDQKVDKDIINKLNEGNKISLAFLLKSPIDLSKSNYIRAESINKWVLPLIIKKDYNDITITLDKLENAQNLINHLDSYNLNFKISKKYLERIRDNYRNNENNKMLLDLLNKFKRRPRVRDKVTSDDGKITIEVF
jgi:hypothetical protein